MIVKNKDGREIEIESVYGKYDDDIQIEEAYYVDTGEEVSEKDIDYIMDAYSSEIYDMWFQNGIMAAEYYWEGDR